MHVDVVVVAYNSRDVLRDCVAPLAALPGVGVTIVDNDSPDDSAAAVEGLEGVRVIRSGRNGGFAFGCNLGAAGGTAPWVLLLNPDARIDEASLRALYSVGESDPGVGLVGPRLLDGDGRLAYSQRRFARLRSTWSTAFFLQRLAPNAAWSDEILRDPAAYERPGAPEWVSGACMLVRRSALEAVGGLDERFFLYREDMDLCKRLREAGHDIRFEPAAVVSHVGGASSGEGATLPIFAASRLAYARAHFRGAGAALERAGVIAWALTHTVSSVRRPGLRRGHMAALRVALRPPS